eukprot:g4953.t1
MPRMRTPVVKTQQPSSHRTTIEDRLASLRLQLGVKENGGSAHKDRLTTPLVRKKPPPPPVASPPAPPSYTQSSPLEEQQNIYEVKKAESSSAAKDHLVEKEKKDLAFLSLMTETVSEGPKFVGTRNVTEEKRECDKPVLLVTVDIDDERSGIVEIFKGDDPTLLAKQFCHREKLPVSAVAALSDFLFSKMKELQMNRSDDMHFVRKSQYSPTHSVYTATEVKENESKNAEKSERSDFFQDSSNRFIKEEEKNDSNFSGAGLWKSQLHPKKTKEELQLTMKRKKEKLKLKEQNNITSKERKKHKLPKSTVVRLREKIKSLRYAGDGSAFRKAFSFLGKNENEKKLGTIKWNDFSKRLKTHLHLGDGDLLCVRQIFDSERNNIVYIAQIKNFLGLSVVLRLRESIEKEKRAKQLQQKKKKESVAKGKKHLKENTILRAKRKAFAESANGKSLARAKQDPNAGMKASQRLYQSAAVLKEAKEKRRKMKEKVEREKEMHECVFVPKITVAAKNIKRKGLIYNHLYPERKKQTKQSVDSLSLRELKELAECTFRPLIDTKSAKMALHGNKEISQDRHKLLYLDAKRRIDGKSRAMEICPQGCTFRPDINRAKNEIKSEIEHDDVDHNDDDDDIGERMKMEVATLKLNSKENFDSSDLEVMWNPFAIAEKIENEVCGEGRNELCVEKDENLDALFLEEEEDRDESFAAWRDRKRREHLRFAKEKNNGERMVKGKEEKSQKGKEEKYQKGKKIRRGGKSKIENYEKIENIYPIKSPPRKKKLPRKENLRPSQATFDRLHRTYVERDAKLKALREFEHSVDLQTGQNLFVPQINPTNLKRSKNSKMYRNPDSKPVGEYLFDWKKKQIEKRKAMQQNQTNKRKMLRNGSSVSRRSEIIFAKSQKRKLKHLYQNLLKSKDVKQQLDITTADFSSVPKSTGAMVRRLFKNSENHFIEMNEFVNVIENGMVKWAGTHEGIELRHALNDFFRLVEPRRSEPVPSFTFRPKISRKSRRLVKAREKREEAEYSNFSNSLENEKTIAANEKKEDFFSDALAMIDSVQTSWEIEEEKEKVGAPEEQTRGKEEVVVKKKKNGLKTESK